jgi:hypothetical protein
LDMKREVKDSARMNSIFEMENSKR